MILKVNINSFANKVVHYLRMASFSCHVQGSYLIERNELQMKPVIDNQLPGRLEYIPSFATYNFSSLLEASDYMPITKGLSQCMEEHASSRHFW